MGFSRVRAGDHVIGSGKSPRTNKNINGKHGDVTDVRDNFGETVVDVTWKGGERDTVRTNNVSGTSQCNTRKGCQG